MQRLISFCLCVGKSKCIFDFQTMILVWVFLVGFASKGSVTPRNEGRCFNGLSINVDRLGRNIISMLHYVYAIQHEFNISLIHVWKSCKLI